MANDTMEFNQLALFDLEERSIAVPTSHGHGLSLDILQAIGGIEGEIRVCLQYFFQAWGARGPNTKYRDMLLHTATEEIGHIEMLATAVALNLEDAPLSLQESTVAANPVVNAVMGGERPRHVGGVPARPVLVVCAAELVALVLAVRAGRADQQLAQEGLGVGHRCLVRHRHRPLGAQRPGARVTICCSTHPLPSGSANEAYVP